MKSPSRLVKEPPRTLRGASFTNLDGDFICNKNCFFVRNFSFAKSFLRKSEKIKKRAGRRPAFLFLLFQKKLEQTKTFYDIIIQSDHYDGTLFLTRSQDRTFIFGGGCLLETFDDPSKQVSE